MAQSFIDRNDDSILATSATVSTKVSSESPRPIKRARKAINCEPCRTSKLKCDRGRPCSGCLLRGTSSNCYVDPTNHSGSDRKPVPLRNASLDPVAEIARIRNSLNALEQCLSDCSVDLPADLSENADGKTRGRPSESTVTFPRGTKRPGVPWDGSDLDGALGVGPFSNSLGHLYRRDVAAVPWAIDKPEQATEPNYSSQYFLSDLVQSIPENFEERVSQYSEASHLPLYAIRKDSLFKDLEKVTICPIILAQAFLLLSLSSSSAESRHYLRLSDQAIERMGRSANVPSLPMLELYLLRIQLLDKLGEEEEIWLLRARVLAIALALNLHRDTKGSLRPDERERERRGLAWLGCLWVDRWYAILLRRPPSIHPSLYDVKRPICRTDQPYSDPRISFLELLWPILRDMFMFDPSTESFELDSNNEILGKLLQEVPVLDVHLRAQILYTRLVIYRFTLQDYMDITSLHAAVAIAREIEVILCESAVVVREMPLLVFKTAYFLSEILIHDPPSCVSYRSTMRQSIHSILNSNLLFRETPQYQLLNAIKPLWDEGSNLLLPAARVAVWEQAKRDMEMASVFNASKSEMESILTPTVMTTFSITSQRRRNTISSNDPPSPPDSDVIQPSPTPLPTDTFDCVVPMGINPSMTLLPFQLWEPLEHEGCLGGVAATPFVSGVPVLGEHWIYKCLDSKSEGFNSTPCND